MNSKRMFYVLVFLTILSTLLFACAPAPTAAPVGTNEPAEPAQPAESAKKVVLVGNQRFGDKGPMDDMAAGLDRCASELGLETKKLESESAAEHEEDLRAMAREGYDLVISTFPPMTEPNKVVSAEFPDTKFAAIFQFINVSGVSIPNLWDTEFHGEAAQYILGAVAAKLSDSKKIGFINGGEEPTPHAEGHGFMMGVRDTCPECTVEYAVVGSYEDPAKAKEIALAMISNGVDVIQTNAGKSQLGIIEASKEKGTLVAGDVSDNVDLHPDGFYGYVGISFGQNVFLACKYLADDNFPGGEHGIMDLANGGYYIPYPALERFAASSAEHGAKMTEAISLAKDLEAKISAGEIEVPFITEAPNWSEYEQ